jgi:hypothetical protein
LESKHAEKKGREKKKNGEEVQITVREQDKEEEGKAEKEGEGKAENRGQLCIPKTMRRRILHEAYDTPAEGHSSADRMFLPMKDRYFWSKCGAIPSVM